MKNYFFHKTTFYQSIVGIFSSLLLITLSQNIFPQENNVYSEALIKIDGGVKKSTQVTVKFNIKAFEMTQSKTTASYNELLPGYESLNLFFNNLQDKYGNLSFEKVIPTANWGDTIFYDKMTGEVRKLIDMSQLYHIKFNHFVNIDSIISALEQLKFVAYAHQPIQAVNISEPNDLIGGPTGSQWNLFKIDAPKAWDITKGLQEIKVAEIDVGSAMNGGGPNKNHPDFQLLDGSNKFADGGDPTIGGTDHATEVCGIIGASTNNDIGIASLGWNVKILSYYFYNSGSDLQEKIDSAVSNGAKVINLSFITVELLGTIGKCDIYRSVSFQSVVDAITNAINSNVVVIAGVGNRGYELIQGLCLEPDDYEIFPYIPYPAATPGVIGVSATDMNDHFPDYLNYNHEFNTTKFIDVAAPGIDVKSTSFNSYDIIRGTSFSAPHVSALVGLIKSVNEAITPAQVTTILQNTAEKVDAQNHPYDGNGRNSYLGYGRINAYKTLKYTLENYGGTLTQNLTIPAGETWNFTPGVTVKFSPNTSLLVNGTLNAIGTPTNKITFTSQTGTTNSSWGTITLNGSGAAGSTIKYANIKYGTKVEAINTSNITIQYCNIDTTYDGIRFNNSSGSILNNKITTNSIGHGIVIENGSTNVTVNDNVITKTYTTRKGVGIDFGGGAGGTAARNDIYGWDWGICAIWSSSPTSTCGYSLQYNNRIRDCNSGFTVYRLSYPVFGIPPTSDNMWNSLSGNSYNAKVGMSYTNYASSLVAYGNYWGGYPPDAAKFQVGPSANIYYSYALTSDPWSGMSKIVANTSASSDEYNEISQTSEKDIELILYGNELRGQGKYSEAKDYFISYINENPDNQIAYIQLYNCYNKETANEITKFFSSLPEKASKDHKLLLSYLYLKNGDYKNAKEVNNFIIAENPNTELATKAKLNNVYIALYNEDNINEAITTFNDALSKSKLSTAIELSLVHNAIETYGKTYGKEINGLSALPYFESSEQDLVKQEGLNEIEMPDKYELLGNYPNPFNPSTTISYALPYQSSVELIIYDLMGREVKSFNVSSQSAGYNSLVWDGRNNIGNPVTSGVYFYRISIKSLENNESFVKTAKLMMLK